MGTFYFSRCLGLPRGRARIQGRGLQRFLSASEYHRMECREQGCVSGPRVRLLFHPVDMASSLSRLQDRSVAQPSRVCEAERNTPSPLLIGALRSASRTLRGLACLLYIFVKLVVSILNQRIHAFDNGASLR